MLHNALQKSVVREVRDFLHIRELEKRIQKNKMKYMFKGNKLISTSEEYIM